MLIFFIINLLVIKFKFNFNVNFFINLKKFYQYKYLISFYKLIYWLIISSSFNSINKNFFKFKKPIFIIIYNIFLINI